jgi:L-alanine-DL-glutamate epimerase-like enolase superfamily enzyme
MNRRPRLGLGQGVKKKRFTALKLQPVPIELSTHLRESVGDDVDLIGDGVFAHSRQEALRVGRALEQINYFWYEAPLPPDDVETVQKLATYFALELKKHDAP